MTKSGKAAETAQFKCANSFYSVRGSERKRHFISAETVECFFGVIFVCITVEYIPPPSSLLRMHEETKQHSKI